MVTAVLLGGAACATGDDSVLPQPEEPAGEAPAAAPAAQPGQAANLAPAEVEPNAPTVAGECGCKGRPFVDADGDGVCDHKQAGGCGRDPERPGFVDADGDGVCDHLAAKAAQTGPGCGCGKGPGCGRDPERPGFVDADGDGVCDHLAEHHGGPAQ
jgi:hypothetical protein